MSKLCLSNNSESTEANLTELYRKIEHNEKVCHTQELDSYPQGQGHNQSEVKLCLKSCRPLTTTKLMKLHRKIKHNEKVCSAQDLGSYAQGQGCSQVRGQNRVSAITQKLLCKFNETSQKDKA